MEYFSSSCFALLGLTQCPVRAREVFYPWATVRSHQLGKGSVKSTAHSHPHILLHDIFRDMTGLRVLSEQGLSEHRGPYLWDETQIPGVPRWKTKQNNMKCSGAAGKPSPAHPHTQSCIKTHSHPILPVTLPERKLSTLDFLLKPRSHENENLSEGLMPWQEGHA